jgi:hypothetical protein
VAVILLASAELDDAAAVDASVVTARNPPENFGSPTTG